MNTRQGTEKRASPTPDGMIAAAPDLLAVANHAIWFITHNAPVLMGLPGLDNLNKMARVKALTDPRKPQPKPEAA